MNTTDIDARLAHLEPLILKIVRKRLKGSPKSLRSRRDEVAQACRLKLWTHALPRYQPGRGANLDAYAQACIQNTITDELRKLSNPSDDFHLLPDEDELVVEEPDAEAQERADSILLNPEEHLSKAELRLLAALLETPDDRGAIAERFNITRQIAYERISRLKRQSRNLTARVA